LWTTWRWRAVSKNSRRVMLLVLERLSNGTRTYRLVKGSIQLGYALELWRIVKGSHKKLFRCVYTKLF